MRPKKRNPDAILYPRKKRRVIAAWEEQEQAGAKIIGGRRTRGSGCGKDKGDVKDQLFLGQCKTTSKGSFTVKMVDLCLLCVEARSEGKLPLFVFGFDQMPRSFASDWYALPADLFSVLRSVLRAVAAGDLEEAQQWTQKFSRRS